MFEDKDYLAILEEMMNETRNDVDKSEGSLLWESLAAAANEFEVVYKDLEETINNAFITTADREHLIKHADTYNLVPYSATYAVVQADFVCDEGVEIEIGSRFTYNQIFYTVIEKISNVKYNLRCEQAGTIGNRTFGQLLPVFSLQGFRSANITALLIPGEEDEETETFRQRVIQSIAGEAFGGNALDYIEEVNAIAGVGDCKIIRCPRGEGSVDVIIIDSNFGVASEELVEQVQNALRPLDVTEPPEIDNCGTGIVPIGHDTIVKSAKGVDLKINFQLDFEPEISYRDVKDEVEKQFKAYCTDLIKTWGDTNNYQESIEKNYNERFISIQINKLGSILFDIPGIHDYVQGSISINGSKEDLDLKFDEIPIFKEAINE